VVEKPQGSGGSRPIQCRLRRAVSIELPALLLLVVEVGLGPESDVAKRIQKIRPLGTRGFANLEAPNSRRQNRIARQRGTQGPARERKGGPDHDPILVVLD
jgi:hypothetical protein